MPEGADANIPLLDGTLADELFSLAGNSSISEMQRQIWQALRDDIRPDLEGALLGEPDNLKSELHRIRGYCSSCGLLRLAKVLDQWESQPCAEEAAGRFEAVAIETALLSIAAMEARYPHLRKDSFTTSP